MGCPGDDKAILAIAQDLSALAKRVESAFPQIGSASDDPPADLFPDPMPLSVLERIYEGRRMRNSLFGENADLFGELAWDILLDVAIHNAKDKRISVTAACIGSHGAPTTALRHVDLLVTRGLLEREDDPLDGRRRYLTLSRKGRALMVAFANSMTGRKSRREQSAD